MKRRNHCSWLATLGQEVTLEGNFISLYSSCTDIPAQTGPYFIGFIEALKGAAEFPQGVEVAQALDARLSAYPFGGEVVPREFAEQFVRDAWPDGLHGAIARRTPLPPTVEDGSHGNWALRGLRSTLRVELVWNGVGHGLVLNGPVELVIDAAERALPGKRWLGPEGHLTEARTAAEWRERQAR